MILPGLSSSCTDGSIRTSESPYSHVYVDGKLEHFWVFFLLPRCTMLWFLSMRTSLEMALPSQMNSERHQGSFCYSEHVCMLSCFSLYDPMDCGPPGSSVHGILQARILQWVAMPSSRDIPDPGIKTTSLMPSTVAGRLFTTSTSWGASAALLLLNLFGVSIIWLVPHLSPTACLASF